MAHPYHHARSSVTKWGGSVEDYLGLHAFFDQSKALYPGPQHRALLHHSAGIFLLERCFGPTVRLSSGKVIPTRWIGEQHICEDLGGRIPTFQDWLFGIAEAGLDAERRLVAQPWMHRQALALSRLLPDVPAKDAKAGFSLEPGGGI